MPYSQVKVYSDGSHYIGIPYEPNPRAKNRQPRHEEVIEVKEPSEETAVAEDDAAVSEQTAQNPDNVQEKSAPPAVRQLTRKELFDELYMRTFDMKKRERKTYIVKQMLPYFKDGSSCRAFVEQNFERKHRNMICRRTRLWRKINHQRFNYFVTFTYADDKMTEEEFAKKTVEYLVPFLKPQGLAVYRRMGTRRRNKSFALSRAVLHPGRYHIGRNGDTARLRYPQKENADGTAKYLFCQEIRAE